MSAKKASVDVIGRDELLKLNGYRPVKAAGLDGAKNDKLLGAI
jgi:hypothetical protein